MEGEPRLATRAPDGQVLREWDRYSADAAGALQADLERALGGAVDFGAQAKALYATDASNYRQVPIGLVYPRSRDEIVEAVRICREHEAPIVARGGGTSLAGQGCNVCPSARGYACRPALEFAVGGIEARAVALRRPILRPANGRVWAQALRRPHLEAPRPAVFGQLRWLHAAGIVESGASSSMGSSLARRGLPVVPHRIAGVASASFRLVVAA